MFEQLSDIEILIVSGEEAEIEDETVQHSEKFVGRRFIEKDFKLFNQEGRVFIDLKETNDGKYFVESKKFWVFFLYFLSPFNPDLL